VCGFTSVGVCVGDVLTVVLFAMCVIMKDAGCPHFCCLCVSYDVLST
jgi:hypothetical protein